MNTYYREADGCAYYYKDGVLYGAPILIEDGRDCGFDEENETPVSDYAYPLTDEEKEEIITALKGLKNDYTK